MRRWWSARSGWLSSVVSSCRCESGCGVDDSELAPEVAVELPQRPLGVGEPTGPGDAGAYGTLHRGGDMDVFAVDIADRFAQLAAAFLGTGRGRRGRRHTDVQLQFNPARPE